ncbi:MAG: CAP domain-containing protein [Terracidiphilus sp.]
MKPSGVGLTVCMALIATLSWAQAVSSPASQQAMPDQLSPDAWQLFQLANQARAAAGVAPFLWDAALAEVARKQCARLSASGGMEARGSDEPVWEQRDGAAGAHFGIVKENQALGADLAEIQAQWMGAAVRRANLLDPSLDRAGVAVLVSGDQFYVVADYAHFVPVLTRDQVEESIVKLLRARGLSIALDKQDARGLCAGRTSVSVSPSYVLVWQDWDVSKLPDALEKILPQAHFRKAAVGSCPAKDLSGGFASYRIAALFYSTGVGVY